METHTVNVPIGGVLGTAALQRDIAEWGLSVDNWRLNSAVYDDSKRPRTLTMDVSRARTGDREQRRFELVGSTLIHPDGEWVRVR